MSHDAHHEGHDHGHGHGSKAKKKKGTKFPALGIVAWWLACSTLAFNPFLGVVVIIALGLTPSMAETIMYPFQKISEIEDKKKEGEKKDHHAHTDHH